MKISRVTQSGNATNVAISPDGRYMVYALREGEKQSLNVRQVATGSDVPILPLDEVVIWSLTFSPDANYIDFVRSEKPDFTDTHLYRMPVLGGTPHLAMQGGIDFGSSYSPDGRQFAFLRANSALGRVDVLIAKADGSDERVLATRPYRDAEIGVAWSPDARRLRSQPRRPRKDFVLRFGPYARTRVQSGRSLLAWRCCARLRVFWCTGAKETQAQRHLCAHCSPDTRWRLMAGLWHRTGVHSPRTTPSYEEPFHAQSV
jgi:dipeptidyl aminopeptidase/acylaminoacyl peptidase